MKQTSLILLKWNRLLHVRKDSFQLIVSFLYVTPSYVFQDYSDARIVRVRGRATLKLHTDKSTINMASRSTEVLD